MERFVTSALVEGAERSLELHDDAFGDAQGEMEKLIRVHRSMREDLVLLGEKVVRLHEVFYGKDKVVELLHEFESLIEHVDNFECNLEVKVYEDYWCFYDRF